MKSTGVTRKIDPLGRVVLPMSLRKNLNINEGDSLEIFTEGKQIILQKYERGCICCGSFRDLKFLPNGAEICKKCLEGVK